jgi:cobalamin biosynthesis Mg chelatase CobN
MLLKLIVYSRIGLGDAVLPDEYTDEIWNEFYDTYLRDKHDLVLKKWFGQENLWARQNVVVRIIEASRKVDSEGNPYLDAPDYIIQSLVEDYMKSVADNGVNCCHHTCGNPLLDDFVQGNMGAEFSQKVIDDYKNQMYDAKHAVALLKQYYKIVNQNICHGQNLQFRRHPFVNKRWTGGYSDGSFETGEKER